MLIERGLKCEQKRKWELNLSLYYSKQDECEEKYNIMSGF